MSDDDLIRRGDAREALREVDAWTMPIAHAINSLPAVTVGVYECAGCGRLCRDPEADLATLRDKGAISCCPERHMEPVAAPDPAAIREAWEKAYWRMRSYAVHDNDCKLNKPPRFDGPCSCGLTAALEEALALIQKGAAK